jgi:hypothetical protein
MQLKKGDVRVNTLTATFKNGNRGMFGNAYSIVTLFDNREKIQLPQVIALGEFL